MNNTNSLPRIVPYLVAAVSFLAVCLIYFAPVIEGRKLPMHDMVQYEGMRQDIVEHKQQHGEDPQWAGRMFGGMPSYLISVDYPSMILRNASSALTRIASPMSLIFLAMLCFFIMTLLCGINPWVGIIPSLAYGLSTYFFIIIGAGHMTKMVALAYAPLLMGGVFYAFRRDMWLGTALTALFASIEIGAGHPQITYYFGFVLAAYWINELCAAVRERWLPRFFKTTGLLLIAALLAVGSNFISLYNIQAHSKYTMRGGSELTPEKKPGEDAETNPKGLDLAYATNWSYGIGESFNMFIPGFTGGTSSGGFSEDGAVAKTLAAYNYRDLLDRLPAYWGDQPFTSGPTYLGAVALFLAVMGLFLLRGRNKWWLLAVSILAVMLAWGSNMMWFTKLFFYHFPGYDKFRTVAMILVIVEWTVPFLASLLLWKIWKGDFHKDKLKKAILNSLYITGGVALLFLAFGGAFFDFTSPMDANLPKEFTTAMIAERASMLRSDSFRSLAFVLAAAAVMWLFMKGSLKRSYVFIALGALVCADMIPVNLRFLPRSSFVEPRNMAIRPTEADRQIMEDKTPGYRVANFTVSTFNDATTSYFHRSIGGYHGAKLQRYQDLIDRQLSRMNMGVYNMLDTRWFIVPDEKTKQPQAQFNPDANGAAWFVDEVLYTATPDEEIAALDDLDTKRMAVVDRGFESLASVAAKGQDSLARIELTDYRVNRLTYKYRSDKPRLAVFSEIYYPDGWTATVDGEPLGYFRADYVLRAAVLPAGEHEVVFSFSVPHYKLLSGITLACCLVILLAVVAALVVTNFMCRKDGKAEQ